MLGPLGQGSDAAVSLAALIAAQRAEHGIPHVVSCRALGVLQAWFISGAEATARRVGNGEKRWRPPSATCFTSTSRRTVRRASLPICGIWAGKYRLTPPRR